MGWCDDPSSNRYNQMIKLPFKKINIVEPNINELPKSMHRKNVKLSCINETIETSDILLFFVEHCEFISINKDKLKNKVILDFKGIFNYN